MVRYYLSEDSELYFRDLVSNGLFRVNSFNDLLLCRSLSDFENFFKGFFSFDRSRVSSVWFFIVDNVWDSSYFDSINSRFFVFNEFESLFFKELLSHDGFLSISDCKCLSFPHGRLKGFLSGRSDLFSHGCCHLLTLDNGRHERSVRFVIVDIGLFNRSVGGVS